MENATNLHQDGQLESPDVDELARLDSALYDDDHLLTDSLREDERRRRRRRLVSLGLLSGGIVMGTTVLAVLPAG
jgi:hypothetical protein